LQASRSCTWQRHMQVCVVRNSTSCGPCCIFSSTKLCKECWCMYCTVLHCTSCGCRPSFLRCVYHKPRKWMVGMLQLAAASGSSVCGW
jgi:hypothetical protein